MTWSLHGSWTLANRESGRDARLSTVVRLSLQREVAHEPDLLFTLDLVDDPNRDGIRLGKARRPLGLVGPVANRLGKLQQIMTRYPNIVPGQKFHGIRIGHLSVSGP